MDVHGWRKRVIIVLVAIAIVVWSAVAPSGRRTVVSVSSLKARHLLVESKNLATMRGNK